MKSQPIEIVDQGRGLQLSTSRITVQDLVPYFQRGCSYDEITRWLPTLTHEEIGVVESYYQQHKQELDQEDQFIRNHVAEQILQQRIRFPEEPRDVRLARMRQTMRERQEKRNGQGHPG